ncbi:MAG: DUF6666 family protein [Pirellulaceae bacterium]
MNRIIASVAVAFLTLLVELHLTHSSVELLAVRQLRFVPRRPRTVRTTAAPSRSKSTTSRRSAQSAPTVARASHDEVVYEDGYVEGGYVEGGYAEGSYDGGGYYDDGIVGVGGCQSCGGGGCGSCSAGGSSCNTCAAPNQFCICFPSHGWVQADYLNWYPGGMRTPPLVTTSNPSSAARSNAGVLGLPTTSVLYGGNDILDDSWSGFRIRFGFGGRPARLGRRRRIWFDERTESFFQQSRRGTPIIARPFFNSSPDVRFGIGGLPWSHWW